MTKLATAVLTLALLNAGAALAGPRLLCHPMKVQGAESLPWGNGTGWHTLDASYALERLVDDTIALLDDEDSALARMETLRRATLYALEKPELVDELLGALTARVLDSEVDSGNASRAWFDAGCFVQDVKQIGWMFERRGHGDALRRIKEHDGLAWVLRSARLREDPQVVLGAAMMSADPHHPMRDELTQRARELASKDELVRLNLHQLGS